MLATCIISGATQRRLKFPAVPFCAQETETVLEPNVRAQHGDTAADGAESEHGIGFMVAINKSGDFTSEAASKRLALLLSLTEMPSGELSERELLMYLDHYLPQESDLSRCAVGGLLSHMQRSEARLSLLALRRHPLKQTVHVSPETLLSLNVFEDHAHPSAHGGRAREGFSLWQLMNKTRSKPGERLLRSWFARPSRDPELLHERLATVELFSHGLDSALPQLHSLIARVKDVCKLQRSFDRGGLLLCDYTNALSTATCAVKMRELLESAEVPTELAIMRRVVATIGIEHTQLANMLMGVIDFEASRQRKNVSAKHICVRSGVHPELDDLRAKYTEMERLLSLVAQRELDALRPFLRRNELQATDGKEKELYVIYVPQFGFLLQMPTPRVLPADESGLNARFEAAGLQFQFDEAGETYYKTALCKGLDNEYGDIGCRMKDYEAHLMRHLEKRLMQLLPALEAAQSVLAELDCYMALALCAREFGFSKPRLHDGIGVSIQQGWHPLLRQLVPQLVPNDCTLGSESAGSASVDVATKRLLFLTGPNSSGKTVYLRTVALIVFIAHIGSFVPAESAVIGLTDAIYTRMLCRESVVSNASAFMVDLSQMAQMMRNATRRSLCLVDEFGKGTSAQDGICLLYACLRHFLDRGDACPNVLACTHYTELLEVPTLIEHRSTMVCSMQVMIQEKDEDDDSLHTVVFLYRVALGRSPESFGWHCAVQAQMPAEIVQRARHISRCQIEGVPILPIGSGDPTQDKERLQRELVDAFLAFDLDNASSLTFFAENEAKLQTLSACRTAA